MIVKPKAVIGWHRKGFRLFWAWECRRRSPGRPEFPDDVIYRAFIESDLDVPKHWARPVHELYFNPQHEEFQPRTLWS